LIFTNFINFEEKIKSITYLIAYNCIKFYSKVLFHKWNIAYKWDNKITLFDQFKIYILFFFLFRLNLNELLNQTESSSNQHEIVIAIDPPINANQVSDEDSGDEMAAPMINNLPGSILSAPAELFTHSDQEDDEDEKPAKNARTTIEWTPLENYSNFSCTLPEWNGSEYIPNEISAIEAFEKFIPDDIIKFTCHLTNLYAQQQNHILNATENEIKCFFAILFYSSYVSLPRFFMYWEKAADVPTIVSNAMRRNRFVEIKKYLHVADNFHLPLHDKFAKVRAFINLFNRLFLANAPQMEFHSVDESMVPYYGRHSGKQFLKGKPIRFGYKFWCGTLINGYLVWFQPYGGKDDVVQDNLGVGGNVVISYGKKLLDKEPLPYHLVFDNFFNSHKLQVELNKLKLKGTGTIRKNRTSGCPLTDDKKFSKTKRGAFEVFKDSKNNILVCKWHDNKNVILCSNSSSIVPIVKAQRWCSSEKKKIFVDRPQIVTTYNQFMGGVDRLDQNIAQYRISIRAKKWWYPIFAYALDVARHNAWQYYRMNGGTLDYLAFTRVNVNAWLEKCGNQPENKKQGLPSQISGISSRYDRLEHWVEPQANQTRCGMCHQKTTTRCKKCNAGVHVKCFEQYHTL
jgi:DNA excision repair protein ERCC-6